MSGLVAVLSEDPSRAVVGEACLAMLDHVDGYVRASAEVGRVWLGVCGDQRAVSIASAPAEASAGAVTAAQDQMRPGGFLAAFAGDLLNRLALGRELGVPDSTLPAALTIAAYRRWGAGLFDRFEGVFSLVVHDTRSGLTLAGTDPCCVAPLYATNVGQDVCVASEAKAFLRHPGFRARLDPEALGQMLTFGRTLEGRPLFAGVAGLPHGSHFAIWHDAVRVLRHWDVRDTPKPTLSGTAYVDRLEAVVRQLAEEAFAEPGVVLPLTGGLDSRLFAAVAPRDRDVSTLTFGAPTDRDCALAARIAVARSLPHRVLPLDPEYVGKHAAETVWLLEGRLNPVRNITGSLMNQLHPATAFVGGAGAAAGRHLGRSWMLIPDWNWDHAGDVDFERCFATRVKQSGLPWDRMPSLVLGGRELREAAVGHRLEILRSTRGRTAVERQDLYIVQEHERSGQTGLTMADLYVQARAPLLTRRWIEAMLAGRPGERIDDLARLRLITRLDSRVASVPWSLTHLPLLESANLLVALRFIGRVCRRRLTPPGEDRDITEGVAGPATVVGGALRRLQERLYRHGDDREDWLRGASREYVEEVLLSPRLGDHAVFDPMQVSGLVADHMAGEDLGTALGLVMQIELWQRFFEDRDDPPATGRT